MALRWWGLTLDHTGIPKTVDARLSVARRILDRALSYGIRREDVYIDCLTLTVSAEQEAAAQTLEGLRRVKGELGLKTVLGGVQHLLRTARPAPDQPEFPYHGHGRRPGPAHPQPQCGRHDGGSAVLPPADEHRHRRPGIHRRLRERHRLHLYHQRGRDDRRPRSGEKRGLEEIVEAGLKGEAGEATRALLESRAPWTWWTTSSSLPWTE